MTSVYITLHGILFVSKNIYVLGWYLQTEMMKGELERIAQRQPMEMLNMKRYELPGPAHGRLTDVNAWMESVRNSQAQLQHQSARYHKYNIHLI